MQVVRGCHHKEDLNMYALVGRVVVPCNGIRTKDEKAQEVYRGFLIPIPEFHSRSSSY